MDIHKSHSTPKLNIYDACLFIYLFTLFKVRTILVVTNKNQPTNLKYLHTYFE